MKIVSWNIAYLPKLFNKKKNYYTSAEIIIKKLLNVDPDIICLQELFDTKILKIFISVLKKNNYYYSYTKGKKIKISSGLVIFSKYKINRINFNRFIKCSSEDCLALKGFLHVKIFANNKKINIINTHLNNDNPVFNLNKKYPKRAIENQINQIYKYVNKYYKKNKDEYFIISGDFNSEPDFIRNIINKNDQLSLYGFTKNNKIENIDHILFLKNKKINYRTKINYYNNLSDHGMLQKVIKF